MVINKRADYLLRVPWPEDSFLISRNVCHITIQVSSMRIRSYQTGRAGFPRSGLALLPGAEKRYLVSVTVIYLVAQLGRRERALDNTRRWISFPSPESSETDVERAPAPL